VIGALLFILLAQSPPTADAGPSPDAQLEIGASLEEPTVEVRGPGRAPVAPLSRDPIANGRLR